MQNRASWRSSADLYTRFAVPLVLLVLSAVALAWPPVRWLAVVTVPLLLIAVWDFFQTRHTLRRNYPLIARFRWLMEDFRPYFRSYLIESCLLYTSPSPRDRG